MVVNSAKEILLSRFNHNKKRGNDYRIVPILGLLRFGTFPSKEKTVIYH